MKYYIFRVKDSVGQEYYVVNNTYLGYLMFDSNRIRSILEYNHSPKITRKYQSFAIGVVKNDSELHKLFCDNERLTKKEATEIAERFKLKLSKNKKWYEIVYPNKNSSATELREVRKRLTRDCLKTNR